MHKEGLIADADEHFNIHYIELRSNYNTTEIISGEVDSGLDIRDQNV